jgi:hypothetical protein
MNKSTWHEANKEKRRTYNREYGRKYRAANRERLRQQNAEWCLKNRARLLEKGREYYKKCKRGRTLQKKYGITEADYEQMLVEQGGGCAICGTDSPRGRAAVFHVDHCHVSGKVRGLLCNSCNHTLGNARDEVDILQSAAAYLVRHLHLKNSSG